MSRTTFLPFALPDLGVAELEEVRTVLESGWITTGPKAFQFETDFARYVGAKHAVAVNSCTAAMHLALEAADVEKGDFVLTTPYTFAATAEVIRYFDAIPVFVDVERDTLNMDPAACAATIEDIGRWLDGHDAEAPAVARVTSGVRRGRVRAVIPVHIAGHPCEIDDIAAIAQEHGIALVEDAAHACSASFRGRPIGGPTLSGGVTCFSFYATKTLATGEGGMLTTDDESVAERARVMSLHGISKDAWKRYTASGSWYYEVTAAGFKYNMPDILAALGLAQLRKVDAMRDRRADIARRYTAAFAGYAELEVPTVRSHVGHAWHLYILRLGPGLSIGRDDFIAHLKQAHIGTSVHFIPLHVQPYYEARYGYEPADCPIAFEEYQREISLPIYSRMTDFDVRSVIDAVVTVVEQCRTTRHYAIARH